MNLLLRNASRLMKSPLKAAFWISETKNLPTRDTNNNFHTFIPNVYGLQVNKHIFPKLKKTMQLSKDEIKFYQKVSPNYVVALIKKVIDEGTDEENYHTTPYDKFYHTCTYCKIKYFQNNSVEIQGLYKVKIQNIQELTIKGSQSIEDLPQSEERAVSEENLEEQEEEGIEEEEQQKKQTSIQELLKNFRPKQRLKKKQDYYSLKVKKINEPPLVINPQLEIKFKYLIQTYIKLHQSVYNNSLHVIFNISDVNGMLDIIANECSQANISKSQIQSYIQAIEHSEKIDLIQKLLQKTMHVTGSMIDIENEAKNNLKNKKFYEYYSEIMKIAKQVLDGKKTKQLFIEKSTQSFNSRNPPKQIKEIFDQEIQKYEQMDENSMEAGVVKTYIQQLSKIPYNVQSQQLFDLDYAEKVLDEEHYGMKEVKDAILEIIAVGKLKKTLKGKIFCFVGGPGLGKTTFASSIAKALNRKFYNISLGGVTDSSVLKGHRRTYIGAYSGKIIEALKNCETNNPVILLDEIDKMGSSYQGDPRSELLEILDPNQNNSFVDNFVDVPVDLSNVLFITSANYQQNISKPLLDRMEKVTLSSYTKAEKIQIFNRHLLRRAMLKSGIKSQQFTIPPRVIEMMVQEYSLGEPGVRYLQKSALIILQKIAYKLVTGEQQEPIPVSPENLHQYLGNSYFRIKDHTKIKKGVAISLGGGSYGGRLTYIEAFKKSYADKKDHRRGLLFTGSLGDVFKEAMNISYTYARNFLQHQKRNHFLFENEVHIHAPEGASKKDGSTDSLTIVCALVSLAEQKKVKQGVALTGQLTLNGKVLRTHGIKQKIIVAKRQRIEEVIIPIDNIADVEMLNEQLKEGMKFHYVSSFEEVYPIIFQQHTQQKNVSENA